MKGILLRLCEKGTPFVCVFQHSVDHLVRTTSSSRGLFVDAKISSAVDDYPKDGNYLSGTATVQCRRHTPPDRQAPPSMNTYICVYIYIYVYIHVYIYIYTYI